MSSSIGTFTKPLTTPSQSIAKNGYNRIRNTTAKGYQNFKNSSGSSKIIIIILVILLLAIIIYWIKTAYDYRKKMSTMSPLLISGVVDATKITQTYTVPMPIDGLAQSFSLWIYIQSWEYKMNNYKYLIWKGSSRPANSGGNIYSPAIALGPTTNDLFVYTTTTSTSSPESCNVSNIPLRKWVHIGYVLNNRNVDIYVNGKLERSCALTGVPKLVNDPISICPDGGFYGNIARVQYFSYALSPQQIATIYSDGPLASVGYKLSLFDNGKILSVEQDVSSKYDSLRSELNTDFSELKADLD